MVEDEPCRDIDGAASGDRVSPPEAGAFELDRKKEGKIEYRRDDEVGAVVGADN